MPQETGAEGELQELKNQAQPTHDTTHVLPDSKTEMPDPPI